MPSSHWTNLRQPQGGLIAVSPRSQSSISRRAIESRRGRRKLSSSVCEASQSRVTVVNNRLHFHWNRLIEDINPARQAVQHFLEMHTSRFDALTAGDAAQKAIKLLADTVQREALVLTYNDALMVLGLGFAAGLVLMPLVKSPRSALTADRH